jgi:hypothetical protein
MQMFKPTSSGSGVSSGSKNYLSAYKGNPGNGDFENASTAGFSLGVTGTLTNGIPTGSPTFGSGASGNLSLTLISSGQLAALYSMGYVSSAATTAGNMVASSAFTIDIEDQAKVLNFSIAYKAVTNPSNANWSGTSSNSFAVAIYDVTNSAWIIPSGNFNFIQSSGVGLAQGSFQTTSNSTQYRIVVYNANATSGAVTVYFDDFVVGPQTYSTVANVSNWVSNSNFAPSAGFGTVTSPSYFYRQVGDTAEVTMSWVNGTVSGTTAAITLPFTIDSSKLPSNASGTWVGVGTRAVGVASRGMWANNDAMAVFYDGSATNTVFLTPNSGTSTFTKVAANANFSTSDAVSITFKVPVAGWTSSLSAPNANGGGSGVVAARAHVSSGVSTTALNPINFDTIDFDTAGAITTGASTWNFKCPVSGYYQVSTTIYMGNVPQPMMVYKNGAIDTTYSLAVIGNATGGGGSTTIKCNAGDTLDIRPFSTSTPTAISSAPVTLANSAWVTIFLIQGTQAAAASGSASVNARYFASSTSLSGSLATVVWTTKDFDSQNAMSSGVYTTPVSGKYQVNVALRVAATFSSGQNIDLQIQRSGVAVSEGLYVIAGSIGSQAVALSDIINCTAGQTIQIQASSSGTGPSIVSSNTDNYISIALVGQ